MHDDHARDGVPRSASRGRELVYLILTNDLDPLTAAVADRLRVSGHAVAVYGHPFETPNRCSWFFDSDRSAFEHVIHGFTRGEAADIAGVLVRRPASARPGRVGPARSRLRARGGTAVATQSAPKV